MTSDAQQPGRRPEPRHAPATGPPPPAATAAAARSGEATAPRTSTRADHRQPTRSPYRNIKHQTKTHHVDSLQLQWIRHFWRSDRARTDSAALTSPAAPPEMTSSGGRRPRPRSSSRKPAQASADSLPPGGHLLPGVTDDVVDGAAVVAAVLGSPQAEPQRVGADCPGRMLAAEALKQPGRRAGGDHDKAPIRERICSRRSSGDSPCTITGGVLPTN